MIRPRSLLKPRILIAAFLLVGCVFGVIYRDQLLVACGEYLISERPLQKADAILVLAGGVPERIVEAVDLYKAGYAPRVILTRGEEPENLDLLRSLKIPALEDHEKNLRIAGELGVPDGAIAVLEPRVNSTYSEIKLLRNYCLKEGFRSVILVTSKSHTTRAYKIFNFLAADQIRAIPRASRYDTFDPATWWLARRTAKEVFLEYQKLLHYYLILSIGG